MNMKINKFFKPAIQEQIYAIRIHVKDSIQSKQCEDSSSECKIALKPDMFYLDLQFY
jgi:hypothetical protein